MKILSSKQIKAADKFTIEHEPISSNELMERAANGCFKWIIQRFDISKTFKIFCGTGNNGGDGLAIARMLILNGYKVLIYIVRDEHFVSEDFNINELRLRNINNVSIIDITSISQIPEISKEDIIIDALFGIGFNKPLKDLLVYLIQRINASSTKIIYIDIPSGLFADQSSTIFSGKIIKANYTLSFMVYKLAFLFAENADFLGEVVIIPIGLNQEFISTCQSNYEIIEEKQLSHFFKKRNPFSHKGNYGHAGIIAGSYGKIGAAVLSTKACLRSGVGLLTVHVPKCGYTILQTSVPEAMVISDENDKMISSVHQLDTYNIIGIGPGIGTSKETTNALICLVEKFENKMVIDADAINILSENKECLKFISRDSIFTPHPKEFERLVGKSQNHFERNKMQIEFSKRHQVYVVLKGRYTCITCPDGMSYFNPTGNAGMAKGGSGDVLTGILTSLLAQGFSSKETCLAGVYLHGLAADLAVKEIGEFSLFASDIINYISKAIKHIIESKFEN